jgi:hypothetical protein
MEAESDAKKSEPRNFEQALIALLIALVTHPLASVASPWILSKRPDYDIYGRAAYQRGTATWLLAWALFPMILIATTSVSLKILGCRRWFLPLLVGPFSSLVPYLVSYTVWLVGIPIAEYVSNRSLRRQIKQGLVPVLVLSVCVPAFQHLNDRY